MSKLSCFAALVRSPIGLALYATGLGAALSPATSTALPRQPFTGGEVIVHDATVLLAEGNIQVSEVRSHITEGEVEVAAADVEAELAARFIEALNTKPMPRPTSLRAASSARRPTKETWTCGRWEDLWQGRGHGRSCEWK